MSEKYDVIAVGMGPSSIFMAYELIKLKKAHKVLLIEQGKKVEDRYCPIEKTGNCIKCKPFCNITSGFSGAGASLGDHRPQRGGDRAYVCRAPPGPGC